MHSAWRSFTVFHVAACLLLHPACLGEQPTLLQTGEDGTERLLTENNSKQAVVELFTTLDSDGDGQIRESEASVYLKTQTGQGSQFVKEEAEQLMASLDGSDTDDTISIEELENNLAQRGQGFSVDQWLEFGLELPQYKEAFTRNAVTVLDFPLILKEPDLLQQDLGVKSVLHRRQISRAMQNVALGIGALPERVQRVQHEGTADGSIAVTWQSPSQASRPPVRRTVVSRNCEDAGCTWQAIGNVSSDAVAFVDSDTTHAPEKLRYRVTNWSTYGRSDAAFSVSTPSPQPQTPAPTAERALMQDSLHQFTDIPSSSDMKSYKYLSNSALFTTMPANSPHSPQPHQPAFKATEQEDDEPMSSIMRFLTGIVVTGAAGLLLLQLLPAFAAPPLLADEHTHLNCPTADGDCPTADTTQPTTAAIAFHRTVSWLRMVSIGSSHSGDGDAVRSAAAISRRASGRSMGQDAPDPNDGSVRSSTGLYYIAEPGSQVHTKPLLHHPKFARSHDLLPACGSPSPGSPRGVCHAVSADDLAQVGALTPPVGGGNNMTSPVNVRAASTHIQGSCGSPAIHGSLSPLNSRSARASAPDVLAGVPYKHAQSKRIGSQHKTRVEPSVSCGDLPAPTPDEMVGTTNGRRRKMARGGSGGLGALTRRARKRHDHCNIEGCMYRPWSMLSAAMFHSTAEFHHCSRCQSDFCVNHMAWVTHEKTLLAKCPMDARCICELCWVELRRHGTPVPSIGRAPQKSASFFTQMQAAAGADAGATETAIRPVTSPRSTVGSDTAVADDFELPQVSAEHQKVAVKRPSFRVKMSQLFKRT